MEDHAGLRTELRLLLETEADIQVVGEAATGTEAVQLARALRPDVVVIDLTLPGMNSLKATTRITHDLPGSKVFMLVVEDDEQYRCQMFRAGAVGYVLKKAVDTTLVAAIRTAVRG
ncbi:MAG: response regulator transcription factor [Candidatus Latescibacteria bacterium]|nr:response regulator transcription factor [Candidatus Latescibacterota bacterium]